MLMVDDLLEQDASVCLGRTGGNNVAFLIQYVEGEQAFCQRAVLVVLLTGRCHDVTGKFHGVQDRVSFRRVSGDALEMIPVRDTGYARLLDGVDMQRCDILAVLVLGLPDRDIL